ncbi:MAG: AI-2E family transporter [Oscillospiraceae bacterium]|nr:AI-2E family transporter [Oscillospiraceae bacterium]
MTQIVQPDMLLRVRRVIVFVLIYTAAFAAFFLLKGYVLPLVVAWLLAGLTRPMSNWLHRIGLSERLAAAIATVLFFVLIVVLAWLIMAHFVQEGKRLLYELDAVRQTNRLHELWTQWQAQLPDWLPINLNADALWKAVSRALNGVIQLVLTVVTALPHWLSLFILIMTGTYYFSKSGNKSAKGFPAKWLSPQGLQHYDSGMRAAKAMLARTVRIYVALMCITFVLTLFLLMALGVPYAVLLSGLAAFADIIPVIGPGMVLMPMAVSTIAGGNIAQGALLLLGWVCISAIRHVLEHKWMAHSLSLHPLWFILAMYAGIRVGTLWLAVYLLGLAWVVKRVRCDVLGEP